MTYDQALAYIASLEPRGWRLGLDRMQEFARAAGLNDSLGSTADGPQFIHVAGTNGKGSTTAFVQSILVESGYRTGAFFSPFVVDPRERVQFERNMIEKQELADLTEQLQPVAESFSETEFGGITEFEFKTAIGFAYWKLKRCEWVALEVGLGGRLDATNVVTPRASIVVSIGLDHTHILGETHAKIAFEKAGIIKPNVPVIVGEMCIEAEDVVVGVAKDQNAPVWRWGREVRVRRTAGGCRPAALPGIPAIDDLFTVETPLGCHDGLLPSLIGTAQPHNMALAVASIDAAGAFRSDEAIQKGVRAVWLPGRFQKVQYKDRTILLDGAHNSESAEILRGTLQEFGTQDRYVLVTNMLAGHEPAPFYEVLKSRVKSVHVVPVDFHRATPVEEMVGKLNPALPNVTGHNSILAGLDAALAETQPGETILVTGTFYLVGELLRLL